jgi:hypothetical protein
MKKVIYVALALAFALPAHAGFVTGVIVGSAMSDKGKKPPGDSMVVASDTHDVLVCVRKRDSPGLCNDVCFWDEAKRINRCLTPAEYAGRAGYKTLHRVGAAFHDGTSYITMEVSR